MNHMNHMKKKGNVGRDGHFKTHGRILGGRGSVRAAAAEGLARSP